MKQVPYLRELMKKEKNKLIRVLKIRRNQPMDTDKEYMKKF